MGVCSRRTQRLSGGAGTSGGAQPLPRAGPGTPRPRQGPAPPQNSPAFVIKLPRGQGWGWGSYNLLAVNKAPSGDDAPARLKRSEQSVNETYFSYRSIDMI